jgi:hypothetical protein
MANINIIYSTTGGSPPPQNTCNTNGIMRGGFFLSHTENARGTKKIKIDPFA